MSRPGNSHDNATMESFWAALKAEWFADGRPSTRQVAELQFFDHVGGFHNRTRLHSFVDGLLCGCRGFVETFL